MANRMILEENVLAFGWTGMEREARELGSMSGIWVPWILP